MKKVFNKVSRLFVCVSLMYTFYKVGNFIAYTPNHLNTREVSCLSRLTNKNRSTGVDWVHELSTVEPFCGRILNLRKTCLNKSEEPNFLWENKKSFKYVDDAQLVMCETPKAASTTWQLLLLRLAGNKQNYTKELLRSWDYDIIPNKHFANLQDEFEICKRMENYTTFLITRHPFERLVSAYFDKLSNSSTYHFYRNKLGIQIARNQAQEHLYGIKLNFTRKIDENDVRSRPQFKSLESKQQEKVLHYLQVLNTGEISFYQFAKYLIQEHKNGKTSSLDTHWLPQVLLCHPCHFRYSYVIKFENLASESNRLLDYVQSHSTKISFSEKLVFKEKKQVSTTHQKTQETMRQLPESFVKDLRQLYADDFLLFDYDPKTYKGYDNYAMPT